MKPNAALQSIPTLDLTITVVSGPSQGTVYRVVSSRARLGRGPDNDIVIADDPKCSRHHAELLVTPHGLEIRDISDRNNMVVDGAPCQSAQLRHNSVFTLGETQFRLSLRQTAVAARPVTSLPGAGSSPPNSAKALSRKRKKKKSPMFWVLIAVVGLVLWLGLSGGKKNGDTNKSSDELMQAEIQAAQKIKESAESKRPKDAALNDIGYNQAQQAYVAGFRDFKKGQYERALSSFQACVSLFPSHELCNRYLRLTQRKFDELVQYHMVIGRKYRDQNQYAACRSAFRNVMVMIKDQTNKKFLEAKANYDACDAQVEERF